MSDYGTLIADLQSSIRPNLPSALPSVDPRSGPEVQLSVRVPAGLRESVAAAATHRGATVTGFVRDALERAVAVEFDQLAGITTAMVDDLRAELAVALAAGEYREAAAVIDAAEADDDLL